MREELLALEIGGLAAVKGHPVPGDRLHAAWILVFHGFGVDPLARARLCRDAAAGHLGGGVLQDRSG
jgi:hypothetical protein